MKAVLFHGLGDIRLTEPMQGAIGSCEAFDARKPGRLKVELLPAAE